MASACVLGGAGAALTLDDVVAIAAGGGVVEGEWKRRQRLGAPRGGRRRPTPLPPPSPGAPVTLDAAALDAFLKAPAAFAPGGRMMMMGLAQAADRAAVIEHLKTLK